MIKRNLKSKKYSKNGLSYTIEEMNKASHYKILFMAVIIYGFFILSWILLSKELLNYLNDYPALYKRLHIYKNLIFACVILVLTYILNRIKKKIVVNVDDKTFETNIDSKEVDEQKIKRTERKLEYQKFLVKNVFDRTYEYFVKLDKKKKFNINASVYKQVLGHMQKISFEHMQFVKKLQLGMDKEEFTIYYQPQFNLFTGKIVGMEALIRWIHPHEGYISPGEFIPLAEETGQIYGIERWIFKNVLQQKKSFEEGGFDYIELSINLSSKTLTSEKDFKELEILLSNFDVNYSKIIIEITETAIISNVDLVIERLYRLKNMGVKIALDDFGTGYSSLAYLRKLPIDIIKLDRSFINLIPQNSVDMVIIKHILSMAHDLKYEVIAEGIETWEQLEYMRKHTCETGQGFLLSKPLAKDKVIELLKTSFNIKEI